MNTFEQPIPFQPTLHRTAPIPPPRSSSAIRSLASQLASHSPSRPLPEQPTVPASESQEAPHHHQSQRPNSFYAEADFEDAPPAAQNDAYDSDVDVYAEMSQEPVNDYANEEQEQYNEQRHEEDDQNYHQHQGENSYNTLQQQSEPEFSAEALIRPVAALMQLDLTGELIYFRDRFADLQQGQPGFEQERSALLELERSTEALMTSRKVLTEKQRQLLLLHINDNQRPNLLNEVVRLTTECRAMEHQWRTGKETYHRDYVVVAAKAAAAAAAKANAELKAQTEKHIAVLKAQIANLQRQLDAVAARRSQMLFATQGAA